MTVKRNVAWGNGLVGRIGLGDNPYGLAFNYCICASRSNGCLIRQVVIRFVWVQ